MMSLKKITLQSKLMMGMIAVVVLTVALLVSVNMWQVTKSVSGLGRTSMKSYADVVYSMMEIQNQILSEKVRFDLGHMQREISRLGQPMLDHENTISLEIVNQVTKNKEQATIPRLMFGLDSVNNDFTLVDKVQKQVGGTATIFQLLPGKLLRVSTNVKKLDGNRAVGTYIPDDSVVYKTIMKGETYYGIAYVVNDWYQTGYMPFKDPYGKIIGVIYVGRKIITPAFRDMVVKANVAGKGYGFVYNNKGVTLMHPVLEGDTLAKQPFWNNFEGVEEGVVEYEFKGVAKECYVRYFAPWGWFFGFTMDSSDMTHGVNHKIFTASSVGAAVAIGAALLVIIMIIRATTRPLNSLSEYASAVSRGDYSARVDYEPKDSISKTIESVRQMVLDLKEKLGFSQGILKGISIPCIVCDMEQRISFLNRHALDLFQKKGAPEDYHGQTLSFFCQGKEGAFAYAADVLKSGKSAEGKVFQGRGEEGRECYCLLDCSLLKDIDGQDLGGFVVFRDITEIKKNEEQIAQQRDALLQIAGEAEEIAEQLSSSSEELSAQVEESSRGAESQMERAGETSTAMEQMNSSVLEIAKNASDAAENADQTRQKAREGEKQVAGVVGTIMKVQENALSLRKSMDELGGQTDSIGAVIQVIEDIADQTNLLALNAAIEAARAGDAGRGFAVVADEVRKLAEKTMSATGEVSQAIQGLQSGASRNIKATEAAVEFIAESTEAAKESGQLLSDIVHMVEGTADKVRNIATAAEEQSATSEEINRATDEVNTISTETAQAMRESSQAISGMALLTSNLKKLIGRMRQ